MPPRASSELSQANCTQGRADHKAMLPAGLMPAFVTAATKLNTHLVQQQQQSRQQQQQHLAALVAALLHLWNCMGNPFTAQWVLHVMPTIQPAAELAIHVLGGPGGALAPNITNPTYNLARQHAAVSVALIGGCVTVWDQMIEAEAIRKAGPGSMKTAANREEAPLVSDIVQQATILHAAVFIHACRQQQKQQQQAAADGGGSSSSSSSGSSWAPAEAKRLLQQMGFPLKAVEHYTSAVCKAMPEPDPLLYHIKNGMTRLQCAINIRMIALRERDWAARFSTSIAAAATAATAAGAGSRSCDDFNPGMNTAQHITGPGFNPAQLTYLGLEFICVLGLGQDKVVGDIIGLAFMALMLQFSLVRKITDTSVLADSDKERYATGCLEYIWSYLGRQLQRAAGVADAELEGDGTQAAAAAATGGSSSSSGKEDATIGRESVEIDLPADAVARLRIVGAEYSECLCFAIRWYRQVHKKLPFEIYMRQPMRTSRVAEAAMRAADFSRLKHPDDLQHLLSSIYWVVETTSPEGAAASTDLLRNKRLAVRSCSQLVTALKVVGQPVAPQVEGYDGMEWRLRLACNVAMIGPTVHSWATGEPIIDHQRQDAMRTVQPDRMQGGPALFGMESVTLSTRYQKQLSRTGGSHGGSSGLTMVLALHASALGWLHEQLQELQSHPTAAPAAQLPPGMLEELCQLADSLAPRFDHLLKLCDTGSMLAAVNPAAEAAVFQAHLQGCAEGWLPEGLQKLGSKVWTAWPQKYACNDDMCSNMGCLAEHSCGRAQCSGCKAAYYCCRDHQVRHYKNKHKKVCKHLQQQLAQAAGT